MSARLYTPGVQIPTRALVGGVLTDVMEVHYEGPNGITGWVRVPTRTMTAEQVDTLIRAQLDKQLQIAALGAE